MARQSRQESKGLGRARATRRGFLAAAGAAFVTAPAAVQAGHGGAFRPDPKYVPQIVRIRPGVAPGEIHVDSAYYFLYFTLGEGRAMRYGVGVGSAGHDFSGPAMVGRKAVWPRWTPTQDMLARDPEKYGPYADGMPGGPNNPLGSRALYLFRDGRDTLYRIHGTPEPETVGRSVSSGCIRMINAHVTDLYNRAPVGTRVMVY